MPEWFQYQQERIYHQQPLRDQVKHGARVAVQMFFSVVRRECHEIIGVALQ
jgi:hypothetical protein